MRPACAADREARRRSRACAKPGAGLERVFRRAADGRPFVTTYHGAYGEAGPLSAYNSVMGRGDRVIANSRYTALIASRHATAKARIRTIHRGVDRNAFDPLGRRGGGRKPPKHVGASRPASRSCFRRRGSRG